MDTNRGEHNKLILIINNIVQQKQYVGIIWIDILSNVFLLNIAVVLPFNLLFSYFNEEWCSDETSIHKQEKEKFRIPFQGLSIWFS